MIRLNKPCSIFATYSVVAIALSPVERSTINSTFSISSNTNARSLSESKENAIAPCILGPAPLLGPEIGVRSPVSMSMYNNAWLSLSKAISSFQVLSRAINDVFSLGPVPTSVFATNLIAPVVKLASKIAFN